MKVFKKKPVVTVFNGEEQIQVAQKKVASAMNMFEIAAKNVELANEHLIATIEGVESQLSDLAIQVAATNATKAKALQNHTKNLKILDKLSEFVITE